MVVAHFESAKLETPSVSRNKYIRGQFGLFAAASIITAACQEADDQLIVGMQRHPGLPVASAVRRNFRLGDILPLGMNEGPDFVALHLLGADVADLPIECIARFLASISGFTTVPGDTSATHAMDILDDTPRFPVCSTSLRHSGKNRFLGRGSPRFSRSVVPS
ncbi:hypothetical protein [Rhodopila sp.]|jgi:hypothetical protein|uniref:hypothetical protein n=1 Tax=Rhodopila sp. TaxID=2480087 RepID=UPI002C28D630|nr:hypothetical protein [Rhodopila sp.]HVZ07129.1 hypothetical protein [Rhodopila sp.]